MQTHVHAACRFQDAITAAKAYDKAAVYLYGVSAITNFGIDACLSDPTGVGSCILRAREEAEQAAANRHAGNSHLAAIAAAAAAYSGGSNTSPSSSFSSSSPNSFIMDSIGAVQGSTAGGPQAAIAAARACQQQQAQQQSGNGLMALALPQGAGTTVIAAGTAVASTSAVSAPAAAVSGLPVKSVSLHIMENMHINQQQQQHTLSAVGRALSLPTPQHTVDVVGTGPAPGVICGMTAVHSADQASLLQLLLGMQQQQQQHGFTDFKMHGTYQADQSLLLPIRTPPIPSTAAAACQQLFTQQPQVFQITASSSLTPVMSSTACGQAAAAANAANGLLLQQHQQQNILQHQAHQSLQQQQQDLQQQFNLLGLTQRHQGSCSDGGYSLRTAAGAADTAAASAHLLAAGGFGSSSITSRSLSGAGIVGGWVAQF